MSDNQVLDLGDLEPQTRQVRYRGKCYLLFEASAGAAVKYRDELIRAQRWGEDGQLQRNEGYAKSEAVLVSECLYRAEPETFRVVMLGDRPDPSARVPLEEVLSWPDRVQRQLFRTAEEISELGQDDSEENVLKRIGILQRQLERIRKGKAPASEVLAKNGQSAGAAASKSPTG